MDIYDYCTNGGKNLILEYIDALPKSQRLELYSIREEIREHGMDAFEKLITRQLRGKQRSRNLTLRFVEGKQRGYCKGGRYAGKK